MPYLVWRMRADAAHASIAELREFSRLHSIGIRVFADDGLAYRRPGSSISFARTLMSGHRSLYERLERARVRLLSFVDVDRSSRVAFQPRIEEARGVWDRGRDGDALPALRTLIGLAALTPALAVAAAFVRLIDASRCAWIRRFQFATFIPVFER
jgi:hypothetical protein